MTAGGWREAQVTGAHAETDSARTIRLSVSGWPGNDPGQHVDVRLTAEDGYQAVRSYSLATFGDSETIELAVDEIPDGEVSPYLVRDVRVGDELEVKGPLGRFFVWRPETPGPVQLIAGGSGIVPLISMVRAAQSTGATDSVKLLYSVRAPHEALYRSELEAAPAGAAADVRWAFTRSAPDGWAGTVGRVTEEVLREATWPPQRVPLVFVCGPTGFVEHVADLLVGLGHAPERVRTERFGGK